MHETGDTLVMDPAQAGFDKVMYTLPGLCYQEQTPSCTASVSAGQYCGKGQTCSSASTMAVDIM